MGELHFTITEAPTDRLLKEETRLCQELRAESNHAEQAKLRVRINALRAEIARR